MAHSWDKVAPNYRQLSKYYTPRRTPILFFLDRPLLRQQLPVGEHAGELTREVFEVFHSSHLAALPGHFCNL